MNSLDRFQLKVVAECYTAWCPQVEHMKQLMPAEHQERQKNESYAKAVLSKLSLKWPSLEGALTEQDVHNRKKTWFPAGERTATSQTGLMPGCGGRPGEASWGSLLGSFKACWDNT